MLEGCEILTLFCSMNLHSLFFCLAAPHVDFLRNGAEPQRQFPSVLTRNWGESRQVSPQRRSEDVRNALLSLNRGIDGATCDLVLFILGVEAARFFLKHGLQ